MKNNQRTFGIEIELVGRKYDIINAARDLGVDIRAEGYNHSTRRHWKIVSDSSIELTPSQRAEGLRPMEIVSPPLRADQIDQIEKICQAIKIGGGQVNRTCGLHVHHDASDFTLDTMKNLYKLFYRYEGTIDSLVAPSRRGNSNRFCRTIRDEHKVDRLMECSTLQLFVAMIDSRYYKLNCRSYITHGTVEFRNHQGTVNAEKIINWVQFTQLLVERAHQAVKDSRAQVDDWGGLKGCLLNWKTPQEEKELFRYYTNRRKVLAA